MALRNASNKCKASKMSYKKLNAEANKQYAKKYSQRPDVKEKARISARSEAARKRGSEIRKTPEYKARMKEYKRAWISTKKGASLNREYRAKRRAAEVKATPPWANHQEIRKIYMTCPEGCHVDHFVPLHGVTFDGRAVCGLHIGRNLRHLPSAQNLARHNKLSEDDIKELENPAISFS